MPRPTKTTLVSFQHAFDGIAHVFRTQRYARMQGGLAVLVIAVGAMRRLTREQWFAVYMALAITFLSLMISTAVTACVDLFSEQHHPAKGRVCEIATGATLAATVIGMVLIVLVFLRTVG
ncbi:MAG TPA: diacylglycerol kinase family protein [Armatimonadota bacterium]|jgi:diacylglycerol kinase (ATP)